MHGPGTVDMHRGGDAILLLVGCAASRFMLKSPVAEDPQHSKSLALEGQDLVLWMAGHLLGRVQHWRLGSRSTWGGVKLQADTEAS